MSVLIASVNSAACFHYYGYLRIQKILADFSLVHSEILSIVKQGLYRKLSDSFGELRLYFSPNFQAVII